MTILLLLTIISLLVMDLRQHKVCHERTAIALGRARSPERRIDELTDQAIIRLFPFLDDQGFQVTHKLSYPCWFLSLNLKRNIAVEEGVAPGCLPRSLSPGSARTVGPDW